MKNQIQIEHTFFTTPDEISVYLNDDIIYRGPADIGTIDFFPSSDINILTVTLDKKQTGNFYFDCVSNQVTKNSQTLIKEIIVENRYFRSLVIKCGLVEIDLEKNLNFPSKYIDHENCLTMEGSIYLIKFQMPIKHWMQIHLNGRDLRMIKSKNDKIRSALQLNQKQP
jgi:hypothetical protein